MGYGRVDCATTVMADSRRLQTSRGVRITFLNNITVYSDKNLQAIRPMRSVYHCSIHHADHLSATLPTTTMHFLHPFCITRIRWLHTLESGAASKISLIGGSLSCASHLINNIIFLLRYSSRQAWDAFLRDCYPRTVAPPPLSPVLVPFPLASGAFSAVNVTKTRADDLLGSLFSLVDQDFVNMPGTEDACQWKVITVTVKANKQIEYGIQFADCNCPLPMEQDEIINLMMDSSLVNK